MSTEATKVIEDLGRAFEEFKISNDARLKEVESKGSADPLLSEKVEKANADVSRLTAALDSIEKELARKSTGNIDVAKDEHGKAFNAFMRRGIEDGLRDAEIKAAITTDSDPDGGFLVPEFLDSQIGRVAEEVSAMRRLSSIMTIGTDTYKKLVGVGGAGSGWVGERASRKETDTPTLVEIAINTKEIYANPAITQKSLDDASIDVAAWLAGEVAIEFSEQENAGFITGNGVERPKGILAYETVANASYAWGKLGFIASGASGAFTNPDKLIDLQHGLKSAYRNGASFLMNDLTLAHVRKFKDGEGNYLWKPGLELGAPSTLLGKPVEIDDNMPDIDTNKFPIAFGNFARGYLVIDRTGVRVLRDPYTNKPYVHFYTTKRVGGGVVNYEAIKLLKVAAS
jgi:HK97 family phage major capsid protein